MSLSAQQLSKKAKEMANLFDSSFGIDLETMKSNKNLNHCSFKSIPWNKSDFRTGRLQLKPSLFFFVVLFDQENKCSDFRERLIWPSTELRIIPFAQKCNNEILFVYVPNYIFLPLTLPFDSMVMICRAVGRLTAGDLHVGISSRRKKMKHSTLQ